MLPFCCTVQWRMAVKQWREWDWELWRERDKACKLSSLDQSCKSLLFFQKNLHCEASCRLLLYIPATMLKSWSSLRDGCPTLKLVGDCLTPITVHLTLLMASYRSAACRPCSFWALTLVLVFYFLRYRKLSPFWAFWPRLKIKSFFRVIVERLVQVKRQHLSLFLFLSPKTIWHNM